MTSQAPTPAHCPDCGTELSSDRATEGLCPKCLLSLALHDFEPGPDLADAATLDGPSAGRILGGRYQMRELLGRGGMGEVWRAFDLKLRLDVALKAIRPERAEHERAKELLRQEVRSAREVVSPNVCRIVDLVVEDGEEMVSMELVDGTTLAETLRVRGPLQLQEAREIASQFLSGLEAIHQAGLVHRDFKPENVMLTRAGRVVVMDFGLAKGRTEGRTGTVSGTPAYMSPEQARGEADVRTDVYSAGRVLAEMLVVGGEGAMKARQALWKAAREDPPQVPEGPWAPVLRQAVAQSPAARHPSARALARALEEITLRLPGFEEKSPYPGLSSFTEADAEYFYGREVEVEAVLQKLKRPRLLALIGPSGAGKSSFLGAGLLPALPKSWRAVLSTPGSRPFQVLAQALVPLFSGDTQATQALLRFEDLDTAVSLFSRWKQRSEHVVVVVDQFEELFTLNPPEVQEAFAKLLGRLVLEADVHVLVSLRDDFLFRCHAHEALTPILSDLTLLGPLSESALRRALVQPALACGYRFEDESLVDEMVGAVRGERGALPLLAFAASRLWEKRDRERGLLTRQAYEEIGGVGGALAQHAEATLEHIGPSRTPVVRELFRNLITSQGTRAARERGELLSVFGSVDESPERLEASGVLDALIGARLLTAYERPGEEGAAGRQEVEVIHESLLANWPRLVRWQTQDADGAQLRDQLRQAAQVWQGRGRLEDLLWSGTAYRDFAVWKERYPGSLSATEEAFAEAAARRAGRRRRQRRIAAAAIFTAMSAGLAVVASLWSRADTSRQKAEAAALRAESSQLLVLGQLELDRYPSAAVAYALKSLELADSGEARLFALRALQQGPTAFLTPILANDGGALAEPAFSPNGEWLALGGWRKVEVFRRGGSGPLRFGDDYPEGNKGVQVGFGSGSDVLVGNRQGDVRVWSLPDGRVRQVGALERGPSGLWMGTEAFVTSTTVGSRDVLRRWPMVGDSQAIGSMEALHVADIDVDRGSLVYAAGPRAYIRSLDHWAMPPRLFAEHAADITYLTFSPDGQRLAASDQSGEIRIWPTAGHPARPQRILKGGKTGGLHFDSAGSKIAGITTEGGHALFLVWDLAAPSGTEPRALLRNDYNSIYGNGLSFEPSGRWLATAQASDAALWRLDQSHPHVLLGHEAEVISLAFTPDGTKLVSAGQDSTVRVWPLSGADEGGRILLRTGVFFPTVAVDAASRNVVLGAGQGRLLVVPIGGGPAREFERLFGEGTGSNILALDPTGRFAASVPYFGSLEQRVVKIVDLETGRVRTLPRVPGTIEATRENLEWLQFLGPDRLLVSVGERGLLLYDLREGTGRLVAPYPRWQFAVARDERFGVGITGNAEEGLTTTELVRFTLDGAPGETLTSHGNSVKAVALDRTGTVVATSSVDGTIRIGPVSGGEPYVFYGHDGQVWTIAFSPDGRWLASGGNDRSIRLWPVPDTTKPPPHKWDRERFLAMLRGQTNLRALPDPQAPAGWKVERGPFPGWAEVPSGDRSA